MKVLLSDQLFQGYRTIGAQIITYTILRGVPYYNYSITAPIVYFESLRFRAYGFWVSGSGLHSLRACCFWLWLLGVKGLPGLTACLNRPY